MRKNFYPHSLELQNIVVYRKVLFPIFGSIEKGFQDTESPDSYSKSIPSRIIIGRSIYEMLVKNFTFLDKWSKKQIVEFINRLPEKKKTAVLERIKTVSTGLRPEMIFRFKEIRTDSEDSGLRMDAIVTEEPILVNDIFRAGINEDYIKAIAENNINLINVAYKEHYEAIQSAVLKGIQSGQTSKDIAKEISAITGVSKSKAEFWAQDQTSKFFGDIQKFNQVSSGFDGFIWRSVRDSRVRQTHQELEGKFFTWKDGTKIPGREYPGRDYRCRCFAEPAFSDEYSPAIETKYKAQAERQRLEITLQTGYDSGTIKSESANNDLAKLLSRVVPIKNQTLAVAELEISKIKDKEIGIVYNENGNQVFRKEGIQNSIYFEKNESNTFKDMIFTHNHTGGSSFSYADIINFIEWGLKEMRIVTPNGGIYKIGFNGEIPNKKEFLDFYFREYFSLKDSYGDKFKELSFIFNHELNLKLAKKFDMYYDFPK